MEIKVSLFDNQHSKTQMNEGDFISKVLTGTYTFSHLWSSLFCPPPPPAAAAASVAPRRGQRVFVGHRARGGRGPGLGTDPEEAPGPPLDGVGLHSHSNGYGSDIEKAVCSERRCGAKKPHHGLQV